MPARRACARSTRVHDASKDADAPVDAGSIPRTIAAGSVGTRIARAPNFCPIAIACAPITGCRWKCLCALTWSSGSPVAAKASNCAAISAATWRRTRGLNAMSKPSRAMSARKQPSAPTRSGMRSGGRAGFAWTSTRCRPARKVGMARARRTASAAAGLASMRLAAERIPVRCAISTAALTSSARPKSSAVTIRRLMRRLPVRAQEGEELDALAQAALHHLRTLDHLADDRRDLRRAEIEAAVEVLDRMEDLAVAEMRIVQRRDLHALVVDQLGVL